MEDLVNEEKLLQEKLCALPKQRWEIWKLVVAGLAITFVIPHITKNGRPSMIDQFGFYDVTIFMGIVSIIILIGGSLYHLRKVKLEIVDTEIQLELLELRKNRYINRHITRTSGPKEVAFSGRKAFSNQA